MMRFLRKHRQWLMIVIAVLALPFVFYFVQKPDYGAMRRDQVGTIYGRSVQLVEFQRNMRLGSLSQALGLSNLWLTLSMRAQQDAGYQQFAINLIILEHEAERFGIQPEAPEIATIIRNMPAFRNSAGFDAQKYDEFVSTVLPQNGFSEAQIEQLASDEIALKKIKQLLSAGVSLPEADVKSEYNEFYGKNFVQLIRLNPADFAKEVKITDDDAKKYYDTHQKEFNTEEKRKVDLVQFTLNDAQKKLAGKERVDLLQKLQDRASDFVSALQQQKADFRQVAAKLQVPVEETGEFTATAPDPKLKGNPQLMTAASQLTKQAPDSDIIEEDNGYYVMHLASLTNARPLTFEEAKPKVVQLLQENRERQLAFTKGTNAVQQLRAGLKAGQPLSSALEQVKLKAEKLDPFVVADEIGPKPNANPKKEPLDMPQIRNVTAPMEPGEVSDFIPSAQGGFIVYLEKREPPDQTEYAKKKAEFDQRYLNNKREIVFQEWLLNQQLAANIQFAKS